MRVGAHPRSRGENDVRGRTADGRGGSSPLTRGKHLRGRGPQPGAGLIPAHAGKTWPRGRTNGAAGAHPRSRGENQVRASRDGRLSGSSPLTRGKRTGMSIVRPSVGLIPAHAGKTAVFLGRHRADGAHPRSRGENSTKVKTADIETGSSPLTRGKQRPPSNHLTAGGLIPAHAGKTPYARQKNSVRRAHPRSRGENSRQCPFGAESLGSSPLTRGKPRHRSRGVATGGLIPAHAGKTFISTTSPSRRRAHPRSRGENSKLQAALNEGKGSSPLTRGKLATASCTCRHRRLIPAHAGKTFWCLSVCVWAHPRSRGENFRSVMREARAAGSSPLTRGKPRGSRVSSAWVRLIPAHAGKTRVLGEGDSLSDGLIPAHAGKTR